MSSRLQAIQIITALRTAAPQSTSAAHTAASVHSAVNRTIAKMTCVVFCCQQAVCWTRRAEDDDDAQRR